MCGNNDCLILQVAVQGPLPEVVGTHKEKLGLVVKHVDVEDDEEEMIIDHFESSSLFIRDCVAGGGSIAVVCAQGVSRSVALVLAYMMQYSIENSLRTVIECLDVLRQNYPDACPNQGFMQQLETWYDMKFQYDLSHETYRSLCARKTATLVLSQMDEFDMKNLQNPREKNGSTSYRCRSCRTNLATSDNIMVDVSVGTGKDGFSWRKRTKDALHQSCTYSKDGDVGSIFVEPLRWMSGITESNQGKLYCPGCSARLGSYNWSGMQNEASEWITPAFQLHLSKIDAIPSHQAGVHHGVAGTVSIRQPKLLGKAPQRTATTTRQNTKYLIFDCDGVLVDSERASCESLRRSILEVTGFDIPHSFPQDFVPVFGMDVRSCLEYYMKTYADCEELFKSAVTESDDWMRDLADRVAVAKKPHYESITSEGIDPIQGSLELMKDACSTCIHPETRHPLVAIASSGSHAKIRHNLSSAHLWGIVDPDNIISAEEVPRGKPHPDVYIKALEKLKCDTPAEEAIVIEDSIHGIHAAVQAGVGHIAAMTTSLSHDEMHKALCSLRNEIGSSVDEGQSNCMKTYSSSGVLHPPLRVPVTPTSVVSIIGSTLPVTFEKLVHLVYDD